MFSEVGKAGFEVASALIAHGLHRGDEDAGCRLDTGAWHDDVHVLFKAEVGGKAGLVDDVIGEAQAHLL
jgi:hypothetical protein